MRHFSAGVHGDTHQGSRVARGNAHPFCLAFMRVGLGHFVTVEVNRWARNGKVDSSASEKARLAEAERIWPLGDVTGHKQCYLCSYGFGPRGFRGIFCERAEGVGYATPFSKVRRTEAEGQTYLLFRSTPSHLPSPPRASPHS